MNENKEIRSYLKKIDEILNASKELKPSEKEFLYDLVSDMFRNGFDEEFGEKK